MPGICHLFWHMPQICQVGLAYAKKLVAYLRHIFDHLEMPGIFGIFEAFLTPKKNAWHMLGILGVISGAAKMPGICSAYWVGFVGLQKCLAYARHFGGSLKTPGPRPPPPTCVWHMRGICQKAWEVLSVAMAYAWHFLPTYREVIEVQICQAYADVAHKPRLPGWPV